MLESTTIIELFTLYQEYGSMFLRLSYDEGEGKHPSYGYGILLRCTDYSEYNYYRIYAILWDDDSNDIGYVFGNNVGRNIKFSTIKFYKFAYTG